MASKEKYTLFNKVHGAKAVIVDNGVYLEADCYTKGEGDETYVRHRGGFVKLLGKTNEKNTFGSTSHPKVRWVEVIDNGQF